MRLLAMVALVTLLGCTPVSGQFAASYPYGLDPFNPSDAALLRQYGSVLVAQTPLLDLRRLDPFKPSDAALLRDLGGAMPLWGLWYPPVPASFMPLSITDVAVNRESCCPVIVVDSRLPSENATTSSALAPGPLPQKVITALRPATNDGLWIRYGGQRWISAGCAVRFDASLFTRIGDYNGFPVFRQEAADVIYLPTRPGVVAPYRLKVR